MKKTIGLLVLLISIKGASFAQEDNRKTKTEKTFELPPNYPQRRFTIELDKGNKIQIELVNLDDLNYFINMDSVLRVFFQDIEPLNDSLANELTNKRIDYLIDSSGIKKIRIQQFTPKGSSFLVSGGDIASLKLEQDTVNFIGKISYRSKYGPRRKTTDVRYYRLSFFVNKLNDMAGYMDGSVSEKIKTLQQNINSKWITTRSKGTAYLGADEDVSAKLPKGYVAGGDFLNMRFSVDAQNYKNYFVPSFSLGAGIILSTTHWKREVVLAWEPNFFFAKNTQGKWQTFRNDFITLTAGHGPLRDNDPHKESFFVFTFTFSYLVKKEGDYFEKGTMRLGMGQLSLFEGKTKLQPALYFTHLFKGVTPGIRWIQSF